jgi:hypothetical protein
MRVLLIVGLILMSAGVSPASGGTVLYANTHSCISTYLAHGIDAQTKSWSPSTSYKLTSVIASSKQGELYSPLVLPKVPNGRIYSITAAGTSGTAEPAWPLKTGDSVTKDGVTYTCLMDFNNTSHFSCLVNAERVIMMDEVVNFAGRVGINNLVATGMSFSRVSQYIKNFDPSFNTVNRVANSCALEDSAPTLTITGIMKNTVCTTAENSYGLEITVPDTSPSGVTYLLTLAIWQLRNNNPSWNAWDARAALRMNASNYSQGWQPYRDGVAGYGLIALKPKWVGNYIKSDPMKLDIQPPLSEIYKPESLRNNNGAVGDIRFVPFNSSRAAHVVLAKCTSQPSRDTPLSACTVINRFPAGSGLVTTSYTNQGGTAENIWLVLYTESRDAIPVYSKLEPWTISPRLAVAGRQRP